MANAGDTKHLHRCDSEDNEMFYEALGESFDVFYDCREDVTELRTSTELLDTIFGPQPPLHLLQYRLPFRKPRGPHKSHKPSGVILIQENAIFPPEVEASSDEERDSEIAARMSSVQIEENPFLRISGTQLKALTWPEPPPQEAQK